MPTSSTIDVGETQTYTPTGVDQFGDTMSLTVDNVDSSNVLIATTDRFMFSATGVAEGSVVITFMSTSSGPSVSATADLTVVLPDLTAPVITLLGTTPINVEYNSTYTDDGATALDDRDGDITGSIVTSNPVDTSILGIYTVTYDVSDAAGNDATQVTRTVNVVDTTAPVITLTGVNPQTIEWGAGYTELGATADDGSTVIIDASAVNVGTLGSYLVTYNATDASSNSAIQVTRTVNVVDTNAPTVVSVDSDGQTYNTLTVSPFVITVTFNEDVSVSPDISVSGGAQVVNNCGDVDAKTFCFSYSVPPTQDTEKEIQIMNAEDATGNVMFDNFMHTFLVDTIIPVITLDGADPQTIEWGDGYTELGATADDGSTVVPDASAFVDAVGSYLVTYNATDVSGNPAMTIMRTVNVVDTTAPVITLTGANPQTIEWGAGYTELGATTDDGSALVIDTSDFVDAVGSYTITYDATDASLNAATTETRTVNVVDTTAPIITLTGANPQTIEAGTTGYVELGATTDDGSTVIIDATAFVDAVGSYSVTYNATDASSNSALEVTRTVNVVDTTAPVITLLGSTPLSVRYNSTYTDAGATALDTVDGDVTGSIVTNNPVDTLIPGTYTVTYDVSDVAGNPATQVTRSVTVEQQPASTGSRARRATPAIPATPGISPAFPAIPSANANVAGGLFTFMRHLGLGLSGEDVTALQNRLMAEGVYSGPVTGYFGPLTLGAVQAYQRKMGISDTGFVGPLTLARLNGGLALGNPSSNPLTTQQITEKRTQLLNAMQELVRLLQSQLNAQ